MEHVITLLQLFGIGFSFSIAGPCIASCMPFLAVYFAAKQTNFRIAAVNSLIFLSGRLFAYMILGAAAGASGMILQQFSNSGAMWLIKTTAGIFVIAVGILILTGKKPFSLGCRVINNKAFTFSSLIGLGFVAGIFPCAPLVALLFEISLISKTVVDGMLYASVFGLGTFAAGFIVIMSFTGIIWWLPSSILKSPKVKSLFSAICAFLIIILGLVIIFRPLFR